MKKHKYVAHVDISPDVFGRVISSDINITCDSKIFIQEILNSNTVTSNETLDQRKSWLKKINQKQENYADIDQNNQKKLMSPKIIFEVLSNYVKHADLVVTDCGQHQIWTAQLLEFKHPKKFLSPGGLGTMGFGVPASIGASIANRSCHIWCIIGD